MRFYNRVRFTFSLIIPSDSVITKEIADVYYTLADMIGFNKNVQVNTETIDNEEERFKQEKDFILAIANQYLEEFGQDNNHFTSEVKTQFNILNDPNSSRLQVSNAVLLLNEYLETFYGSFDDDKNIYKQAKATRK